MKIKLLAIIGILASLGLSGCAEQRAFDREVKQDQAAYDYGAGKKPNIDATGYHP